MHDAAIAPATHQDVDDVAALASIWRSDYERHQPVFWRQAPDALERHSSYLHSVLDDPDVLFLVARHDGTLAGFLIGRLVAAPPVYEPGGLTCLIDDFAVAYQDDWGSMAPRLLRVVAHWAQARGAVQAVVVTGQHDNAKREALSAAGLAVSSEWWMGPLEGYDSVHDPSA